MPLKAGVPGNSGSKCRLLYVVGQLGAGGLERQLYLLLRTMDRDLYQPHVVVWNFSHDDTYVSLIQKLGVSLHYFPRTLSAAGKMLAVRRIVRELSPEVIHSYSFYTNIAVSWAALGTEIVAVGGVRSNFSNDRSSSGILLGRLSARWPRNQIFNNFAAAEKARSSQSFFSPRKIFVVQNRVDLKEFRNIPVAKNGQARILGIGSLIQCKRWDRLLRAASTLKTRGFDFRIDIVGDGPLRHSLEQLAVALGVAERVSFKGHTDHIPTLLAGSDFLAHTSDIEGCPNVVMEAMACGRAVVAMDVGDIPALVDDGRTGFVVECGDDASLADRLAKLIENRDLCRKLGDAARAKAEQHFGLQRLLNETMLAYRAIGWSDSVTLSKKQHSDKRPECKV